MSIQYVFGAHNKYGNELYIAVKMTDEEQLRGTFIVRGIDYHRRIDHNDAKRTCFNLVYNQKWEWLTEDDVFDLCGIRKRPLYGKMSLCHRMFLVFLPVMFLAVTVQFYLRTYSYKCMRHQT